MNAAGTRRWGLALGWLATTALAVGLALAAVGAVSDSVTENRPAPLSAAAVSAALAEGTSPDAEAPTDTTDPSSDPAPSTSPPSTSPTTRQTSPPATTKPSASTATTATTTPVPSTSPTTVPDGSGGAERTYEMVGGSVRVRFADGRAEMLSATPRAGFRVERTSGNPSEVRVTFRSDDHESRFRAWWDSGPREEIEEKER